MGASTLSIVPQSWFSWNYAIMAEGTMVARIELARWREKGELTVEGVPYKACSKGFMSRNFILESSAGIAARAMQPNILFRSLTVTHEDKEYILQAESPFRRAFALLQGDHPVGSIAPEGIFALRAKADFSIELPMPLKVFIIWLVILRWKRAADFSSHASIVSGF